MKALANPPDPVRAVGQMLMILKPNDTENEADGWGGARIMLGNPDKLLDKLKNYDKKFKEGKVSGG